jgi:DNA-directed RNA polymerase alpha subunit|tara:strand:- start:105 stop:323 length:219 start_codon:yes stop_codon:yes gene_type:complete
MNKEITPETIIYNADISGRTIRCLYAAYGKDMTIRELSKISLRRILRLRGIGKKSKQEIINLFNNVGLSYIN